MRKDFFNRKENNLNLNLITCGYEDCKQGFLCGPHIRAFYLIHYVVKGEGYYEVLNKKYKVSAGEIFIIYPDEVVTYYSCDPSKTWSFCWIGFDGDSALEYLDRTGVSHNNLVFKLTNYEFFTNIMNCIDYVYTENINISQFKLNGYLLHCFASIEDSSTLLGSQKKHNHYVSKAINYVECNYIHSISSQDVVKYLNINRSYFYRIFKDFTGISPEKFIMKYRIDKAIELISLNKYTFTEISQFVGIKDVYYFSKLFKKITGITPSQYKSNLLTKSISMY